MTKHTPGPWYFEDSRPIKEITIFAMHGPIKVCSAIAHGLSDARLVAAAPELLSALIHLSNEVIGSFGMISAESELRQIL